ncbi:MAG: ribosome maturation factor RimP [Deltaproteobacteria bacterium]|nr:ribosome maturation factor RimP [Deltaproteobacteria bacterium]
MRKEYANLWKLIEPYVVDAGLELVELQFGREPEGQMLRLFIDYPQTANQNEAIPLEGAGGPSERKVGFEECERVSRDVSAALDVADVIKVHYRLEVSSPGIERPVRKERDFQRFCGQNARIRTEDAIDGRRNFSGVLLDAHDGVVDIDCDGVRCHVPIEAISRAHLVPDWDLAFSKPRKDTRDTVAKHGRRAS